MAVTSKNRGPLYFPLKFELMIIAENRHHCSLIHTTWVLRDLTTLRHRRPIISDTKDSYPKTKVLEACSDKDKALNLDPR